MWFIADLFERYTNNVAKTFIKLAAMEAEANQRALEDMRARRRREYAGLADGRLVTRPAMVHPATGEALTAETVKKTAVHRPKGFAEPQPEERRDPGALLRSRLRAALTELPMGVRGEVVVKYVDALVGASRDEIAAILDKLRKDKKVRVAELQVIVAAVLDEEPTPRKKAEHIAALRRHLVAPLERPAAPAELRAIYPAE